MLLAENANDQRAAPAPPHESGFASKRPAAPQVGITDAPQEEKKHEASTKEKCESLE